MTKSLITLLAAVGIALVGAAVAAADEVTFIDEVREKVPTPLANDHAFALGRVACDAIRDGVNSGLSLGKSRAKADEAVGYTAGSMGLSLGLADVMFLTEAAEHQLC